MSNILYTHPFLYVASYLKLLFFIIIEENMEDFCENGDIEILVSLKEEFKWDFTDICCSDGPPKEDK